MNEQENRKRLGSILRDLLDEIDVPPSKYREAQEHYQAVGAWLGAEDSNLAFCDPTIYPQGSFALGTAVRPLGDDEYDVDAVCLLQLSPGQVSQQHLKQFVGERLKHPQSPYKHMIKPPEGGRRCWTIQYADSSKFHLDVLPAIPDDCDRLVALGVPEEWTHNAICITDRKTWNIAPDWPRSNPKDYVSWFKQRMRVRLDEARRVLAMEKRADVETIEDFEVRTPLQRLIQLLKRHRDVRHNGDDDKPISIIITTLAAQAYNNEADLAEAILNVLPRMRQSIGRSNGVWLVPNPVNPEENFADKWNECTRKAELFFEWLTTIEREYRGLLDDAGWKNVGNYLKEAFGRRDGEAALVKYAAREARQSPTAVVAPVVLTPRKSEHPTTPKISLPSNPGKPWQPSA